MIKLVAVDLDGTIVGRDNRMHPKTRAGLECVRDAGIPIVVCTGRRVHTAWPLVRSLGLGMPYLTNNGALVKQGRKTLFSEYLDPALALEQVRWLQARSLHPMVFVDARARDVDFYLERMEDYPYEYTYYMAKNTGRFALVDTLDDVSCDRVIQIEVLGSPAMIAREYDAFRDAFGCRSSHHMVTNTVYHGAILESFSHRVSKWLSLGKILRDMDIGHHEVLAIGDDYNDIPLVKHAGVGCAMAGGVDAIKQVADFIAPPVEEGGVAVVLRKYLPEVFS